MRLPRMPGIILLVAAVVTTAGTSSCGHKDMLYPEEHQRYKRIDAAMETLRAAYETKDAAKLDSLFLPMDVLERLDREIKRDFEQFEEIALDWGIDRIMIQGDVIEVYLHWQGTWKRKAGDTGLRERGHGMLRWIGVHSILLSSVEGDVPFGISSRQPAARPRTPAGS